MKVSIIDGIKKAYEESLARQIMANAVLINDAMFCSRIGILPPGEVRMICGLKAYYCPTLPDDVLFALCEISQKSCSDDTFVRCKDCAHFDSRWLDEDGKFWCEYSGMGRITPHGFCCLGKRKDDA